MSRALNLRTRMRIKKIRKISFQSLANFFFYLFFVFLPFQIDALIVSQPVFFSGFLNPYLSHFFYISDVFLIFGLLFWGISLALGLSHFSCGDKKLAFFITLFFVTAALSLLFSVDSPNSLFYLLRLLEFILLYFAIINSSLNFKKLFYVFLGVMFFVALIGIFQYLLQHSLGLNFIGEPVVSNSMKAVAKIDIFEETFLRAYGTFSHPNIFAGYLIFAVLLSLHFFRKSKQKEQFLFGLLIAIFLTTLLLTFSRSGFLAILAALFLYYVLSGIKISFKYLLLFFSLILFLIVLFDLSALLLARIFVDDQTSFVERSQLLSISKNVFLANPWGVGFGNFTEIMQFYAFDKLAPWNFQPVHNIYLLILNELGFLGLLAFLALFAYLFLFLFKNRKKSDFAYDLLAFWIVIFVVGLFDHYFFSLYQGQALFWSYISFTSAISYNHL